MEEESAGGAQAPTFPPLRGSGSCGSRSVPQVEPDLCSLTFPPQLCAWDCDTGASATVCVHRCEWGPKPNPLSEQINKEA